MSELNRNAIDETIAIMQQFYSKIPWDTQEKYLENKVFEMHLISEYNSTYSKSVDAKYFKNHSFKYKIWQDIIE